MMSCVPGGMSSELGDFRHCRIRPTDGHRPTYKAAKWPVLPDHTTRGAVRCAKRRWHGCGQEFKVSRVVVGRQQDQGGE